jgi:hypothetical protein
MGRSGGAIAIEHLETLETGSRNQKGEANTPNGSLPQRDGRSPMSWLIRLHPPVRDEPAGARRDVSDAQGAPQADRDVVGLTAEEPVTRH